MEEVSQEFLYFLNQLWEKYPDFQGKPLYMTGESYAGKYIPYFSNALIDKNEELKTNRYDLLASLMGDPYTAPVTQRTHMYVLPQALNIIDDSNIGQIATLNRRCEEQLSKNISAAAETCS